MESQYLCSICIPTYNRAEYLRVSLATLVKAPEVMHGLVEIVISDNASTDNTEEIGKDYAAKYEHVKYFRNSQNINDANFPLALSRGKGVLRKIINDTAIFNTIALRYLCDLVLKYSENRPHLFFANVDATLENKEIACNFYNFIMKSSFSITWLGSLAVWDSDCQNLAAETQDCDLKLWQVSKMCALASAKDDIVIINNKLVDVQIITKKNISYGIFKIFYVNYFIILDRYIKDKPFAIVDREFLEKDLLFNFFFDLLLEQKLGNTDKQFSPDEDCFTLLKEVYAKKTYWQRFCWKLYYRYYLVKLKMSIKFWWHRIPNCLFNAFFLLQT